MGIPPKQIGWSQESNLLWQISQQIDILNGLAAGGGGGGPCIVTDATATVKGVLKLAGDLGGTADLPTVPELALKAPINNPTFTGTVTAPTFIQSGGTANQILMANGTTRVLGDWVDYSLTSTIVGWSSFAERNIFYKVIDDVLYVLYWIDGTSNSVNTTFTLPFPTTAVTSIYLPLGRAYNNGAAINGGPMAVFSTGINIVSFFINGSSGTWGNTSNKRISGVLTVKI